MKSLNASFVRSVTGFLPAIATLFTGSLACADESLNKLDPFLKQHCYDCHGPEKQKGDIRFDTLGKDLSNIKNLEIRSKNVLKKRLRWTETHFS